MQLPPHRGRPHKARDQGRWAALSPHAARKDGARVVQATADGTASQQWQLRPQTGGVFLVVNRNSGKVLDVRGGSTADGVALIQYHDTGGSNQRWTFHRVTG